MEQLLPYTETVGSMLVTMQGMESGEDVAKNIPLGKIWDIRELKHRRFWATDVNRKSRLLLSDVYFTLLIQKVKL